MSSISGSPIAVYQQLRLLLAVLSVPGCTLISVLQMFGDPSYRTNVLAHLDDPVVKAFWDQEFAAWNDRYRSEATAPIQNKVGQFLSSPVIRGVVGQARGLVRLRRIMDEGGILIANLSEGRIGEDASMLLGSLLVTGIQQAAMSRSESDWLVGINGTRAMTAFNSQEGGFHKTTVGRVQTPTLAILVEREENIKKFVSKDYWEIHGNFATENGRRQAGQPR